jgi:AAA15 family ATPase/GTPase
MLLQFRFKNYKSFKNETIFDMTATSFKEHSYSLLSFRDKENALPLGAIYGANASGKSNFIKAFDFMKRMVLFSLSSDEESEREIPIDAYKFTKNSDEELSEFEVFFFTNETEYQYGFIVNKEKVFEEWLYRKSKKNQDRVNLFKRKNNEVIVNEKMKKAGIFKDFVDNETLFISLTNKTNIDISKDVVQWFRSTFVIKYGNSGFERYMSSDPIWFIDSKKYKDSLEEFLKLIDLNITGLEIKEKKDNNNKKPDYDVFTKHLGVDGEEYLLPLEQESDGTRKMLCLYNFIYMAFKHGTTLFIDELNAKLHPLLVKYIIDLFRNPEINQDNAQLIFTTHDTSILSRDVFRRDEVWFTEVVSDGTSTLYSLAEYKIDEKKVRNDASFAKDYLLGRYGAIPVLKEFKLLGAENGNR